VPSAILALRINMSMLFVVTDVILALVFLSHCHGDRHAGSPLIRLPL